MIHWAEGLAPNEFKEQLAWFAEEVMPAFKGPSPLPPPRLEPSHHPRTALE